MSHKPPRTSDHAQAAVPRVKGRMYLVYSMLAGAALGMLGVALAHDWVERLFTANSGRVDLGPARVHQTPAPGPAPRGMVWISGGVFWMGMGGGDFKDAHGFYHGALPRHKVEVDGFWMDETEVTNAQFAEFVEATHYVTLAEKWPDPKEFTQLVPEYQKFRPHAAILAIEPGLGFPGGLSWNGLAFNPSVVVPFSLVFKPVPNAGDPRGRPANDWWQGVEGASWRHPEGPGSDWQGRKNHPVVHICHQDALAFCKWADKRLPTEAEWEFAARGGLDRKSYAWGDEQRPRGEWMANTWQGKFPSEDTGKDGHQGTAPVKSYLPNGFGLYDMAGNAWEWCADWFDPKYYENSPQRNPTGPDKNPNPKMPQRVQRGGSFMCADNYCKSYVPGARRPADPSSAANHIGFRCARSAR